MTKIQWTDETWNPVIGCSKVHTGCTHCYAEVMAARPLSAFVDKHNLTVTNGRWNGRIIEQPERLLLPLKWRKPRRIFVTSMSDIGHPELSDEARARIYGVMLLAGHHTFQNLTKRPAEIERFKREWSPVRCLDALMMSMIETMGRTVAWSYILPEKIRWGSSTWSDVPNIHEYVSVSDQATADEFIPQLLRVPAAVRGVSLEPMVGAVDFSRWTGEYYCPTCSRHYDDAEGYQCAGCGDKTGTCECKDGDGELDELVCLGCGLAGNESGLDYAECWGTTIEAQQGHSNAIDHVIVGGESGRNARPCNVEWIRAVVRQCQAASVPVFVKQLGSRPMVTNASPDNGRLFGQKTDGDWARFNIRLNGGEVRDNDRTLYPKLSPKGGDMTEWPADLRVRMHVGEGW